MKKLITATAFLSHLANAQWDSCYTLTEPKGVLAGDFLSDKQLLDDPDTGALFTHQFAQLNYCYEPDPTQRGGEGRLLTIQAVLKNVRGTIYVEPTIELNTFGSTAGYSNYVCDTWTLSPGELVQDMTVVFDYSNTDIVTQIKFTTDRQYFFGGYQEPQAQEAIKYFTADEPFIGFDVYEKTYLTAVGAVKYIKDCDPENPTLPPIQPPSAPLNLRNDPSYTGDQQIGILWDEPVSDGGSPILDYRVLIQQTWLGSSYTVIATSLTDLQYQIDGLHRQKYSFKVQARNKKSFGDVSEAITIDAVQVPDAPLAPTTAYNSGIIQISWARPAYMGGANVSGYKVVIANSAGFLFSEEPINCNMTVSTATSCTIPAAVLSRSPFSLQGGDQIVAKVSAINRAGQSEFSAPGSGGIYVTAPTAPRFVLNDPDTTNPSQIGISWTQPQSDGGAEILAYQVWGKADGDSNFKKLGPETLETSLIATEIVSDVVYQIKVQARNEVGWGPGSSVVEMIAGAQPRQPAAPTTTLANSAITFSWIEPLSGAPISGYVVQILKSDGSFIESSYCDMEQNTATSCTINIANLRFPPLSMDYGQVVKAKVSAINEYGVSPASEVGGEAIVSTIPDKPFGLAEDESLRTSDEIRLTWNAPNFTGGIEILDYRIQIREGIKPWEEYATNVQGTATTISGLTAGTSYQLKVQARNNVGYSFESDFKQFVAGAEPTAPFLVKTLNSADQVQVSWSSIESNGFALNEVQVFIQDTDGVFHQESTDCDGTSTTVINGNKCSVQLSTLANAPFNLVQGESIKAKVVAINAKGASPDSPIGTGATFIVVPEAPVNFRSDTSAKTDQNIKLNWDVESNGGSPILDYLLSYMNEQGVYEVLSSSIPTNSYTTTFPLTLGETYSFRVQARNQVGRSAESTTIEVLSATTPGSVTGLQSVPEETNAEQVSLTWTAPSSNGGSPIIDYEVTYQTDSSAGIIVVDAAVTGTSFLFTNAQKGQTYIFRIRARNIKGYSVYTSQRITAQQAPSKPSAPTTSQDGTNIKVEWSAPLDNGGASISGYIVVIQTSSGDFVEEIASCNMATLISTSCDIPVTTLNGAAFNLPWGSEIFAKVSAINAVGSSEFSELGAGGFIYTVPDAPVNLANDPSITDTNQIGLTWSEGTFNGGSTVIDYTISLSEESSEQFTDYVTGVIGTSTTVADLTDNKSYKFYVRARNVAGYSEPSQIIAVSTLTLFIPEQASAPLNLRDVPSITNANQIGLEWDTPENDGGSVITDYRLWMLKEGDSAFQQVASGILRTQFTVENLEQGVTYRFKVEAKNQAGYSPASLETSVLAAQEPSAPAAPVTSWNKDSELLTIAWSAPDNGGKAITGYTVFVKQSDGEFSEAPSCVMRASAQTSCQIPLSEIQGAPFSLDWGNEIFAKLYAVNDYGNSIESVEGGGAVLLTLPSGTQLLQNDVEQTKAGQVGLKWVAPDFTGGSSIEDYRIVMDSGDGEFVEIQTGITESSIVVTDLIPGQDYRFKVDARNAAGYGAQSNIAVISAAAVPAQPLSPTTQQNLTRIKLTWQTPDDGGTPITGYSVQIQKSDGTFAEEITSCNMAASTETTCSIPVSTLRAAPFELNWGADVIAKVTASNKIGSSVQSPLGKGAYVYTIPDAPINLAEDTELTGTNQVGLIWEEGLFNGGTPVTSYEISLSEDLSEEFTTFVTGLTKTNGVVDEITADKTYKFYVRARNLVGLSNPSAIISATTLPLAPEITETPPSAPLNLVNVAEITNSNQIGLSWTSPLSDGGSPITEYRLWTKTESDESFQLLVGGIVGTEYTVSDVITQGQTYSFKLEARNIMGYSPFSNEVAILAAQIPAQPAVPTTTLDGDSVTITWTAPDNGGSELTGYQVLVKTSGTTFEQDLVNCNLQTSTLTTCQIPVSTLQEAPFNLVWGSMAIAKVIATNAYGSSETSEASLGALVITVPSTPTLLANDPAITKAGEVGLTWQAPSFVGGSPIKEYQISYALKSETEFTKVVPDAPITDTSFTVTDLVAGKEYMFKVAARNAAGLGLESNIEFVVAASVPAKPATPTTTNDQTNIKIEWTAPDNGGSEITGYVVRILQSDGLTYAPELTNCNMVQSTILTCTIPVEALLAAPFELNFGDYVEAKVAAINAVGTSELSLRGSGAFVYTLPGAVTGLQNVESQTDSNSVGLTWSASTFNGGTPIIDYTIYFKSQDTTEFTKFVEGIVDTNVIVPEITANTEYQIYVTARNLVGESLPSEIITVRTLELPPDITDTPPSKPLSLREDKANTNANQIGLTWDPPQDNGGRIVVDYRLWGSVDGEAPQKIKETIIGTSYIVPNLVQGQTYTFQLEARNAMGHSPFSDPVSALAAQQPAIPAAPLVTYADEIVQIAWETPDNGGSAITGYKVLIQQSDSKFVEELVNCDMSNSVVTICQIPVSLLRTSPFNLDWGSEVVAKVIAFNILGESGESQASTGALLITFPTQPLGLTDLSAEAKAGSIKLTWYVPGFVGGSEISEYLLWYAEGSATEFKELAVVSQSTSYTADQLTAGAEYRFYVQAKNAAGYSPASNIITAIASSVPAKPAAPTTTNDQTNIKIEWTAPDNGGSEITGYVVRILQSDGLTYSVETTNCDMSALTLLTCTIPVDQLIAAPFELKYGDYVEAKVAAINAVGSSEFSMRGSGAFVYTIPDAPNGLANVAEKTESNQVGLTWKEGVFNGGTPVTDYSVYIKSTGASSFTKFVEDIVNTNTVVTGITADTEYQFYVTANNLVGESLPSEIQTIRTLELPPEIIYTPPSKPLNLQNDVANTKANQIGLTWEAPLSDGGQPVIDYRLWGSVDGEAPSKYKETVIGTSTIVTGIQTGKSYAFTLEARNSIGFSPFSDATSVKAAQEPTVPSAPTTVFNSGTNTLVISWAEPFNNGDVITGYQVLIQKADNGYAEDLINCAMSQSTTLMCEIPLATLQIDYGLDWGSKTTAKVLAINSYGASALSTKSTAATIITVPGVPTGLENFGLFTESGQIGIKWTKPAFTGGSDITEYRVSIAEGSEDYSIFRTTTGVSYTASLLEAGGVYRFKVEAKNAAGYGPASSEVSIIAASAPNAPFIAQSAQAETNIKVSWTKPSNGGSPITGYQVLIQKSDLTFVEDTVNCDMSASTETSCLIPVSSLLAAPFNLDFGDAVKVKVIAINAVGSSLPSSVGQGASVLTIPDAPMNLANNGSTTFSTQIGLSWEQPAFDGGSAVIDYQVLLAEDGSLVYTTYQTGVQGTSATVKGLTASTSYDFIVVARNAIGLSPRSLPITIVTAAPIEVVSTTPPSAPVNLIEDPANTNAQQIGLLWSEPSDDGGEPIIDYRLQMMRFEFEGYKLVDLSIKGTSYIVTSNIVQGSEYTFRVQARNAQGYSPWSTPVKILAANEPAKPAVPTTTRFDDNYLINWQAPDNGGSTITGYIVTIRDSQGTAFFSENVNCDMSDSLSTQCTIPMSVLMEAPFNLVSGDEVVAKVQAINAEGTSVNSDSSIRGAVIPSVPSQPLFLVETSQVRSKDSLGIQWTAPVKNGGLEIIDYRVSMRKEGEQFEVLTDGLTETNFAATGLDLGTTYEFKIEARNQLGYSSASDTLSLLAAYRPDSPAKLSSKNDAEYVKIEWGAVLENGSPVTDIKIYVQHTDKTDYSEIQSSCIEGFSALLTDRVCTIKNTDVQRAPYNLLQGDSINVRTMFTNNYGNSDFAFGRGAQVWTKPGKPFVQNDQEVTTYQQVGLTWNVPNNGGVKIDGYFYEYKSSEDSVYSAFIEPITGTKVTITELVAERTYDFRVQAYNVIGVGEYSSPISITVPKQTIVPIVPDEPAPVEPVQESSSNMGIIIGAVIGVLLLAAIVATLIAGCLCNVCLVSMLPCFKAKPRVAILPMTAPSESQPTQIVIQAVHPTENVYEISQISAIKDSHALLVDDTHLKQLQVGCDLLLNDNTISNVPIRNQEIIEPVELDNSIDDEQPLIEEPPKQESQVDLTLSARKDIDEEQPAVTIITEKQPEPTIDIDAEFNNLKPKAAEETLQVKQEITVPEQESLDEVDLGPKEVSIPIENVIKEAEGLFDHEESNVTESVVIEPLEEEVFVKPKNSSVVYEDPSDKGNDVTAIASSLNQHPQILNTNSNANVEAVAEETVFDQADFMIVDEEIEKRNQTAQSWESQQALVPQKQKTKKRGRTRSLPKVRGKIEPQVKQVTKPRKTLHNLSPSEEEEPLQEDDPETEEIMMMIQNLWEKKALGVMSKLDKQLLKKLQGLVNDNPRNYSGKIGYLQLLYQ